MKTWRSNGSATAQRPERLRTTAGTLALLLAAACTTPAPALEAAGMVDIRTLLPEVDTDIRYAGPRNFTGARVEGYEAARCFLLRPAAEALREVARELAAEGLRLRIFDCYRPARAVRQFVRWAADGDDQRSKAEYYPALDKHTLVPGYIADRSGHSKGATVDLTLTECAADGACSELDMGTPFDFFDPRANTDHPGIGAVQRRNRARLREAMARHGFENYPMEWWHYPFRLQPPPDTIHDIPIR